MRTYSVCEIFESIQGEGRFVGTKAVFIRFAVCNLDCLFCDEKIKYKNVKEYKATELLEIIMDEYRNTNNTIILTGGEPMMEIDSDLITILKASGKQIHIETNGFEHNNSFGLLHEGEIDFITYSPKQKEILFDHTLLSNLVMRKNDTEIKIVFGSFDNDTITKAILRFDAAAYYNVFLQPMAIKGSFKDSFWAISEYLHLFHRENKNIYADFPKVSMQFQNIMGFK
jgi:organic radical activating enzyme